MYKALVKKGFRVLISFIFVTSSILPALAVTEDTFKPDVVGRNSDGEYHPLYEMPWQDPVYYDPPNPDTGFRDPSPQETQVQQTLPPGRHQPVGFSVFATPITEEQILLEVTIENNTAEVLSSILFLDSLEDEFEFEHSSDPAVGYNSEARQIGLSVDSLAPGEQVNFEYQITLVGKGNPGDVHRAWVHTADLVIPGQDTLTTRTVVRPGMAAEGEQSGLVNENGGWTNLDDVSVYFPENAVTKNGVFTKRPANVPGNGPKVQYEFDFYEAPSINRGPNGHASEQSFQTNGAANNNFEAPVFIEFNFDEIGDLKNLPGGKKPFISTYDEEHEVWVKVPIISIDHESNSATVEAAHFSTWGAGIGESLPQNGANVLLFDQPYTSLFTGSSRYSIPIWTQPGRNGMQPSISLSYSSATVDGVLGDVQAPWVGTGWNIDGIAFSC